MAKKGEGLFLVYADLIDSKHEEEFNAWYNTEHLPELLALPGFLEARRYGAVEGERSLGTAYELVNVKASESGDWSHQREHSSPRSGRMRELMTMAPGSPGVYRRIFPQ